MRDTVHLQMVGIFPSCHVSLQGWIIRWSQDPRSQSYIIPNILPQKTTSSHHWMKPEFAEWNCLIKSQAFKVFAQLKSTISTTTYLPNMSHVLSDILSTHLLRFSCIFGSPPTYIPSPNIKIFRSRYFAILDVFCQNPKGSSLIQQPKGKRGIHTMAPQPATHHHQWLRRNRHRLCRGTGCFRATFNDGIRNTIRCDLFYVKLRLLEARTEGGLNKTPGSPVR